MVRRPCDLQHLIRVCFERVQMRAQIPQIPQTHSFVAGARRYNVFTRWTE